MGLNLMYKHMRAMSGENCLLVPDEAVEFEKLQIEGKTERCQHETGWTWKH